MRLINLETLELEEFNDHDAPDYAILSHTWEKEEVLFADWQKPDRGTHLQGFQKIDRFRQVAAHELGLKYGWVDTVCIDKSSSAELTEAINSMYRYYQDADECIVYLADVNGVNLDDEKLDGKSLHRDADLHSKIAGMICGSRWITRGWTLQEIIAPEDVSFYDSRWSCLARLDKSLAFYLASGTGIPTNVLLGSDPTTFPVAERMSWAATRTTTRPEDEAYCLLGIFDVSLPLVYGEGRRAFTRLQEEILKRSTDHSILAWTLEPNANSEAIPPSLLLNTDLLAESPAAFSHGPRSRVEECYLDVKDWIEAFEMTNLGLRVSLPLVPCTAELGVYHAVLNCRFRAERKGPIAITVKRCSAAASRHWNLNRHDLQTTTFGVIPSHRFANVRFTCNATHIGRLAIVDEEELITQQKVQITILRSHNERNLESAKPSVMQRKSTKRSSSQWRRRIPADRVKLAVSETDLAPSKRVQVFPEDEWDRSSNIWFAGPTPGLVTFVWEEIGLRLSFAMFQGGDSELPFRVAVFEDPNPENAKIWESGDLSESSAQDLRPGQMMGCSLRLANLQVVLERFDRMEKTFYIVYISIRRQSGSVSEQSDLPGSQRFLKDIRSSYRGMHSDYGTNHIIEADETGEMVPKSIEDSNYGISRKDSDKHDYALPTHALRHKFSFE